MLAIEIANKFTSMVCVRVKVNLKSRAFPSDLAFGIVRAGGTVGIIFC